MFDVGISERDERVGSVSHVPDSRVSLLGGKGMLLLSSVAMIILTKVKTHMDGTDRCITSMRIVITKKLKYVFRNMNVWNALISIDTFTLVSLEGIVSDYSY